MQATILALFNKLVLITFIVIPFWEVLSVQLSRVTNLPTMFFEILKFSFFFGIIGISSYFLCLHKRKSGKFGSLLLISYLLIQILHIFPYLSIQILLNGITFQLLFTLIALLIILIGYNFGEHFIYQLSKFFFVQLILVLTVGIIEYFNPQILEILYNKNLDDIPHLVFRGTNRLLSLVGNPINLSAFILITLPFSIFLCDRKRIVLLDIILLLSSVFVIIFTLSRSAFLILLLLLPYYFLKGVKLFKILIFISLIFVIYNQVFKNLNYDEMLILFNRFGNLATANEYTENPRVANWTEAFMYFDNPINFFWGLGIGMSNPSGEMQVNHGTFIIENSFISTFIEYGLIGFLTYTLIMIRAIYLSASYYFHCKCDAILVFMIVFVLFSLGNDFHRNLPFSFIFWILYGFLENHNHSYSQMKAENTNGR